MIMVLLVLLFGALAWYAWQGPNAFMKRLTAKARFFVTLAGGAIMAGLFLFGDPKSPEIVAPLMGALFTLALLFRYLEVRRAARGA